MVTDEGPEMTEEIGLIDLHTETTDHLQGTTDHPRPDVTSETLSHLDLQDHLPDVDLHHLMMDLAVDEEVDLESPHLHLPHLRIQSNS